MRPKSQTRSLARVGIALCTLLLTLSAISFVSHFDVFLGNSQLGLLWGEVHLIRDKTVPPGIWPISFAAQRVQPIEWRTLEWLPRHTSTGRMEIAILPLWIPIAALAIPTAILSRLIRRRPNFGACRTCQYDLTGNTSGTCPECGQTIANDPASRMR